jgi:hypothetical protein
MDTRLTAAFPGARWILPGNRHERDIANYAHILTHLAS